MWKIYIFDFLVKITDIRVVGVVFLLLFILVLMKRYRILGIFFTVYYITILSLIFTYKEFGVGTIKVYQIKSKLLPEAYMSYKQDLQLMGELMLLIKNL